MTAHPQRLVFLGLITLLFGVWAVSAQLGWPERHAALEHAASGDIAEALEALPIHNTLPPSAVTLDNAATLAWQQEQHAQALADWRAARTLAPRQADIAHNLAIARVELAKTLPAKPAPPVTSPYRLAQVLSPDEWAIFACLAWLIFSVLSVRLRHAPLSQRVLTLAAGGLLASGASALAAQISRELTEPVVVSTRAALLRDAPDLDARTLGDVPALSELRCLQTHDTFTRVIDGRGHTGWIATSALVWPSPLQESP